MSASAGDMDAAWALFHTGMREFPDNVNFAALELILLLNSKRVADAKRRAEFWVHKLKRMGEEYDDYAARLMSMVESREDGSDLQYARGHSSLVESFASIAETEVIRFNAYSAAPKDADEPLVLQATADTAAAERRWMDRSGGSKPMLTSLHSAEEPLSPVEIISALESDSAGLNSFDVLDDITESLDYYVVDVPDLAAVQTFLLQRAETLFYGVLTSSTPKGLITAEHWHDLLPSLSREVPWGFMENRPLLRMMVRHIYHLRDRHLSDSTLWLTRAQVVLQVNNTDNHGLRGLVSSELLSLERPADALQLLDRYPDDGMNDSIMNRTLALFALNRQSEAAETLLDGGIWLREMRKSITQKHYARPRDLDHGQVTLGGRDEAWIYRQAMHSCWEAAGAIEWLKQQKPPRKQKATPPPQQETLEASDNNDASTFAGFDTKPLPAQAIKEQLDKVAPHGAWLLGITLASALTPGLDFSANRLIKPILARLTSDESSSGAFKPENELFESQLFKDVLDTFMAWNNHFISRISDSMGDLSDSQSGDSTNSLSSTDERIRWIAEDLSLASLSKRKNLLDLVNGLVTGIDENPRGWGPISATARNRVIGPLQLMVASEAKEKTVESSTLSNVSFLGLAEDEFFLDEQSCLQNITELASLAILSRRS